MMKLKGCRTAVVTATLAGIPSKGQKFGSESLPTFRHVVNELLSSESHSFKQPAALPLSYKAMNWEAGQNLHGAQPASIRTVTWQWSCSQATHRMETP